MREFLIEAWRIYSMRSTRIGSTEAARLTGRKQARTAAATPLQKFWIFDHTITICSGSGYGSGARSIA
jgi:hypothetical protein